MSFQPLPPYGISGEFFLNPSEGLNGSLFAVFSPLIVRRIFGTAEYTVQFEILGQQAFHQRSLDFRVLFPWTTAAGLG